MLFSTVPNKYEPQVANVTIDDGASLSSLAKIFIRESSAYLLEDVVIVNATF